MLYIKPIVNMNKVYDVIIIGGSASGLQACLTLGRAYAKVLCVDSGKPCNRYAKESHNFLSNDGSNPLDIIKKAREQIKNYPSVKIMDGYVKDVKKVGKEFEVTLNEAQHNFHTKRIIFASGINDNIDKVPIKGIEKFWGNSIIPCPFCHGTEFRNDKTGLYYDSSKFLKMMLPTLYNWSKDLNIVCSGKVYDELDSELTSLLEHKNIKIFKGSIAEAKGKIGTHDGEETLSQVILNDGTSIDLDVLYMMPPSVINNKSILTDLGVEMDPMGLIKANPHQQTTVDGIYACGDNTTLIRALASAVGQGLMAAVAICHELFQEKWNSDTPSL